MLCSTWSRRLDEQPWGTAATARVWVGLEQPGPWGTRALVDGTLDHVTRRVLAGVAEVSGVRPLLVRVPGSSHRRHSPARRTLLVADTAPGRASLVRAHVDDVAELSAVDWGGLVAGRIDATSAVRVVAPDAVAVQAPSLLVCTNGRRDTCCALLGRPVAAALHDGHPEDVWETTHLGGHRLAPTALLLPWGYSYARLDPSLGDQVLAEAAGGRWVAERLRGRSSWSRDGQVAEVVARETWAARDLEDIADVRPDSGAVQVHHRDGRVVTVDVTATPGPTRPESCAKAPVAMTRLRASLR